MTTTDKEFIAALDALLVRAAEVVVAPKDVVARQAFWSIRWGAFIQIRDMDLDARPSIIRGFADVDVVTATFPERL